MRRVLPLSVTVLVLITFSAPAQQTALTVVNATDVTFFFLYVSPATEDSWGLDMLGSDVLEPGGSTSLTVRSADSYDVRAIGANNEEFILWGWEPRGNPVISVDAASQTGSDSSADASRAVGWLEVINETNYEIEELFVVPSGEGFEQRGTDLLAGRRRLRLGESYRMEIDSDALGSWFVDVMLIDEDGDRYVQRNVNLELATQVRFTLDDLRVE